MEQPTVLDVLRVGRMLVAERWARRQLMDRSGGVCAAGGVFLALGMDPGESYRRQPQCALYMGALRALLLAGPYTDWSVFIGRWNDSQESVQPVLELYDRAIAREMERLLEAEAPEPERVLVA